MNNIRMQQAEDSFLLNIFIDEVLWRVIPKKLYFKGLRDVSEKLPVEEYKRCFLEKEGKMAKSSAIYQLSRRSLFVNELTSKLAAQGYGFEAIATAISYCEQIGALNEDKKPMYLIKKAIEKGKGELYIRMYLKKFKIDEAKIDECFGELSFDPKIAIGKLLDKQLKKYNLKEVSQKKKAILFLQRRGFQLDDIFAVISSK